jgi:hypothetical protein
MFVIKLSIYNILLVCFKKFKEPIFPILTFPSKRKIDLQITVNAGGKIFDNRTTETFSKSSISVKNFIRL